MDIPAGSSIPVEAVLKLIVDKTGSSDVENVLKKQDESFSRVEATVGRIGSSMETVVKHVGELAGVAGVGALVDKFVKLETSASNVALAMGKVTGGMGTYGGIRQEMLGVQARTGVNTGEQEAALRALAMSIGLNPKPGQAGMLAEVIAGYSRMTGIPSSTLAGIVGPMLQAEGRTTSPAATAYTIGEARANLGAFPGSQIEGILPVVSNLAGTAALGTPQGAGRGVSVGGISSLINTISGPGSVLRQPGMAQQAAEGIGGTLQGAYKNPRMYAFLKMAGIDFKEQQLGFNQPSVMEKVVREANREYPGASEAAWKMRRLLYLEFGQGEAGADALERIEAKTKTGGIKVATPQMKAEASEAHHAQQLGTPESWLQKLAGKIEGFAFGSPEGAIATGAAGLFGLGAAKAAVGGVQGGIEGLLGGGAEGGAAGGLGLLGGAGLGAIGGVALGLFSTNPTLSALTGGGLAGDVTGKTRQALINRTNAQAVTAVAQAARHKFGAGWSGPQGKAWMEKELYNQHGHYYPQSTVTGESMVPGSPSAATHLLQQALKPAPTVAGSGEGGAQFSEAVKKFSEAVDKLTKGGHTGAAYEGGGTMHMASGAPAVAALAQSVPGMVMAAFLGKGGAAGPGTTPTAHPASFTGGVGGAVASSGWEAVLQKYSGSSYGLSHVEQLAGEHPGGGAHPGDRATVAADAKKYGIPFNVLWGIYGAESSFGKAASNFGLTGQFPGTGTSGNFNTDARMSAEDLAKLVKEMHLHVHVEVGGQKIQQHDTKIGKHRGVGGSV